MLNTHDDRINKQIQVHLSKCYNTESGDCIEKRIKSLGIEYENYMNNCIYRFDYSKEYTAKNIKEFLIENKICTRSSVFKFFKKAEELNLVSFIHEGGEKYPMWAFDGQKILAKINVILNTVSKYTINRVNRSCCRDPRKSLPSETKSLPLETKSLRWETVFDDFAYLSGGQILNSISLEGQENGQDTARHCCALSCFSNGTYEKLVDETNFLDVSRKETGNFDGTLCQDLGHLYYIYYIYNKVKIINILIGAARQNLKRPLDPSENLVQSLQIIESMFLQEYENFSSVETFIQVINKIKSERLTEDFLFKLLDQIHSSDKTLLPDNFQTEEFLLKTNLRDFYLQISNKPICENLSNSLNLVPRSDLIYENV